VAPVSNQPSPAPNPVEPVSLHRRNDLQIEHACAGDGVTLQQFHPPSNSRAGVGNTCRPGSASITERMLNDSAGEETTATRPRVGDDGNKLTQGFAT